MSKTTSEAQTFGNCALTLIDNGYLPLPVKGKQPVVKKWPELNISYDLVNEWTEQYGKHSVGVRGESVQAIDIDVYESAIVNRLVSFINESLKGKVLVRTGMAPKVLIPVRSNIARKRFSKKFKDKEGRINQIEIFVTSGSQWVALGIHPDTRKPYTWEEGSPLNTKAEDLPFVNNADIDKLYAEFDRLAAEYAFEPADKVDGKETNPPKTAIKDSVDYYTLSGRYSAEADFDSLLPILGSAGWAKVSESTADGYPTINLRRPGKNKGASGSLIAYEDGTKFRCFSSSDDLFNENTTYTGFEVRKIVEFNGKGKECIRALVKEGYGDPLYGISGVGGIRDDLIDADIADEALVSMVRSCISNKVNLEKVFDWYEVEVTDPAMLNRPIKLKERTLDNLLSADLPDPIWLIKPIIQDSHMCEIHAYRGIGKTHVAIGIAVAVACGGQFLNWTAPEPSGVIFVDGEMSLREMQDRFLYAVNQQEHSKQMLAMQNLKLISAVDQEFEHPIPCIGTEAGQQAIEEAIKSDTKLFIFDNLSSLLRETGSENNDEYWTPMIPWIVRLRKMGISILFIHHSGKQGDSRGTSKREDLFNTVIKLSRPEDYKEEQGARFEVRFDKARGIHGDKAKPFEAQLIDGKWVTRDIGQTAYEKVIELANKGYTRTEIAATIPLSSGQVSKYVAAGLRKGLIKEMKKAQPGRKPKKMD